MHPPPLRGVAAGCLTQGSSPPTRGCTGTQYFRSVSQRTSNVGATNGWIRPRLCENSNRSSFWELQNVSRSADRSAAHPPEGRNGSGLVVNWVGGGAMAEEYVPSPLPPSGPGRPRHVGRRVQPYPDHVPEQLGELAAIGLRQRRLEDRGDVGAQVLLATGAEQDHVDPGFVAHEAVGRVLQTGGAALVEEEIERILLVGQRLRHLSRRHQLPHRRTQPARLRKDVAHREHQQRADPMPQGQRKNSVAGILVHHREANHDDVPYAVLGGASQRVVLKVVRRGLGDAEVAELAILLLAE